MLLANIIRTLSTEEIARVRKESRLSKRSMKLFDLIVHSPVSPPKSTELCKKLKITPENLYRIYSEMVSECLRVLAPKEEFSTLEFYRGRYLYKPFVTELRRTEKKLLQSKNHSSLERFYEYAFFNSTKFSVSQMNLDLTQTFGEKWHRIKKNPPVDDDLYIALRIIFFRIGSLPSRKKMTLAQMYDHAQALL